MKEVARLLNLGQAAAAQPSSFGYATQLSALRKGQTVRFGSTELVVTEIHRSGGGTLASFTNQNECSWVIGHGGRCIELQFETDKYRFENGLLFYGTDPMGGFKPSGSAVKINGKITYQAYGPIAGVVIVSESSLKKLPVGLYIATNIRPDSLMSLN